MSDEYVMRGPYKLRSRRLPPDTSADGSTEVSGGLSWQSPYGGEVSPAVPTTVSEESRRLARTPDYKPRR